MYKDEEIKPQNKSDKEVPFIPLAPTSLFEPSPILPQHIPLLDKDKPSAE